MKPLRANEQEARRGVSGESFCMWLYRVTERGMEKSRVASREDVLHGRGINEPVSRTNGKAARMEAGKGSQEKEEVLGCQRKKGKRTIIGS